MARINSVTTRLRLKLVGMIDPLPRPGEAWCMQCVLTNGKNLALDSSQVQPHLENHQRLDEPHHHISLRSMPQIKEEADA